MIDRDQVEAFNRDLEDLLNDRAGGGEIVGSEGASGAEHDTLIVARRLHSLRFDSEIRPRSGLKERWVKKAVRPRPRTALRWAWVAAALALVTLLVAFYQPVIASLGQLFGFAYFPEAGFINVKEVRVLQNAVIQQHEGRALTARRGLITARGTRLWLEFSEEARPIDDAWLETADGQRFDVRSWSYSPDEPGTRGVVAFFPPLPADISQVTLALVEGWRIPLTWVPGTQSNLAPANVTFAPTLAPENNHSGATIPDPGAGLNPCAEVLDIQFCVQAAARADDEMQVLLEARAAGNYLPGGSYSQSMFDVPGELQGLTLAGTGSESYLVDPQNIQVGGEPVGQTATLRFPGAQALSGHLSLHIPAVLVFVPLSGEITIDLGENPHPGQVIPLDQAIDVAGLPVHFSQATLEGNGTSTLNLKLISDPLEERGGMTPFIIEPGRPEGIQDRYGAGAGPGYLSISIELLQQSGLTTGILRIPLVSAALKVRGPFTLTFDAPVEQPEPTPEPQVIENGVFEPLPVGEPLPMDAYQYTGRSLQPGDLLAVALHADHSQVYVASPGAGFAPELLAVLPGQVLAVYSHPDRLGIDYITGEYLPEQSSTIYQQLYTLRFGDSTPRLLVGQFERSAHNFSWSFDGHFLAYLITSDQPGQNGQRFIRLIDLTCRESGACGAYAVDTGSQDLYHIEWSPVDYRIALGGVPQDQEYGASDIFLLSLYGETGAPVLTNLTRSPTIDDIAPPRWTPGGDALLYACSTGATDINVYSLCRSNLTEGSDEVVAPQLPWNMHALHLAGDRWLVDSVPVMFNGVYSLRSYDVENGATATLLEWPSGGKYWVETSISPDGAWVAMIIDDMGGLQVMDIESLQRTLVMPTDSGLFFITWVK